MEKNIFRVIPEKDHISFEGGRQRFVAYERRGTPKGKHGKGEERCRHHAKSGEMKDIHLISEEAYLTKKRGELYFPPQGCGKGGQ